MPFIILGKIVLAMIVGYSGYLLECNSSSLKECYQKRLFSCPMDSTVIAQRIGTGSILFLYNPDSKTLIGPFTVTSMEMELEPGSWIPDTKHDFPTKFGVTWEELHQIKNAPKEFPFLEKKPSCALTETQTHRILTVLKTAPAFEFEARNE